MILLDTAKMLLAAGWTIEQVRSELRCAIMSCGEPPTCSYVEEVLREAIRHPLSATEEPG
jgi:hypothetical protein